MTVEYGHPQGPSLTRDEAIQAIHDVVERGIRGFSDKAWSEASEIIETSIKRASPDLPTPDEGFEWTTSYQVLQTLAAPGEHGRISESLTVTTHCYQVPIEDED